MRAPDEVVRTDAKHIKTRQIIMAKEKISLGINLRQNKNSKNAGYGKYYPEVDLKETLTMRGFAEHMEDHGSFFPRYVIEGVLNQICECLPELVGQGVPVKLGSLGTFYPTAEVAENAAVESIAAMDGLNPNDLVKAIHIRFLPDGTKLDNITGPVFKEACALELRNIVDTTELTVNGKLRKMQTLVPIATAVAQTRAGNGGSTGGSTGGNTGGSTGGNTGGNNGGDDSGDGPQI